MTISNPSPPTVAEVLDPAWLNQALFPVYGDIGVTAVDVVETQVTVATKIRFTIECERPPHTLPTALCVKGMLGDLDAILGGSGVSVIEARFYQDCAPSLAVRVPVCHYSGIDEARNQGLIIMEDKVAQGATFLSALTPYGADDAAEVLEQLAILHAASWQGQPLWNLSWIPDFLGRVAAKPVIPLDMLQAHLDGERGDPLPASLRCARRLQHALSRLNEINAGHAKCLVHGDAHAGNIYRSPEGVGLVDWQIIQRGTWAQDVAYHIAAVLIPEDRAANERNLLDHYREHLAVLGGPALAQDDAWEQYRQSMVYGYYLWAITRKVETRITHEFVRRLGLAAADHDSFSLVGA